MNKLKERILHGEYIAWMVYVPNYIEVFILDGYDDSAVIAVVYLQEGELTITCETVDVINKGKDKVIFVSELSKYLSINDFYKTKYWNDDIEGCKLKDIRYLFTGG